MKKIKYFVIIVLVLTIVTGCKSKKQREVYKALENTSISQKGLNSYRVKVSITSKDKSINYIVLNDNNEKYQITVDTSEGSYNYLINNKKKKDKENIPDPFSENNPELEYDYTNTDLFLEVLDDLSKDPKVTNEKIGDKKYKKYTFSVSKEKLNKVLKPFKIKVKKGGKGYSYVDSDNHVYLINYSSLDVNVNVSYTRLNEVK